MNLFDEISKDELNCPNPGCQTKVKPTAKFCNKCRQPLQDIKKLETVEHPSIGEILIIFEKNIKI